eukprot:CAMPEP_0113502258 /NCGR_PEP_ID=MMETSP0014_2-20120614/33440_1 /TAXON_ID=2857 /ORGANISM="Nitzschia sp." /LENGTH=1051 /DNA_ID=CAMNT_0000396997 /DNA_START=225 /DNA_END=3380 /DNA_ORIENTATION=- /assembly_acc=CAM_ASM_000159
MIRAAAAAATTTSNSGERKRNFPFRCDGDDATSSPLARSASSQQLEHHHQQRAHKTQRNCMNHGKMVLDFAPPKLSDAAVAKQQHVNTTATPTPTTSFHFAPSQQTHQHQQYDRHVQTTTNVVDPMHERQRASAALLSVGSDYLSQGRHKEAMEAFDAAFSALTSATTKATTTAGNNNDLKNTEWTDFQQGQHRNNNNKTSQQELQQHFLCPATAALAKLDTIVTITNTTTTNEDDTVHNFPSSSLVDGFDRDITTSTAAATAAAAQLLLQQQQASSSCLNGHTLVTPNSSISSNLSDVAATHHHHHEQTNMMTSSDMDVQDETIWEEDEDSDIEDEDAPTGLTHVNKTSANAQQPTKTSFSCRSSSKKSWTKKNDIPVHVDTYHEDECDVGPRPFQQAFVPTQDTLMMMNVDVLQLIICYNQALVHHAEGETALALQLYNFIAGTVMANGVLDDRKSPSTSRRHQHQDRDTVTSTLARLAMRAHNNMGQLDYAERSEEVSLQNFETALTYAKTVPDISALHQLEIATVLSNWCRVQWMVGRVDHTVYQALEEVLRIRYTFLGWDHIDVASAHFNLGMAEYSRNHHDKALSHLTQYLQVSSHRLKTHKIVDLDPIPGLVFVLLIKNDNKTDKMSQDLLWGLRTLQDKRQDLGPKNAEVASVLNFVGTILFHQRELDHALLFFQEELRLEEQLVGADEDVSVSVTCNNIGRILQELGRYPQAIYYYRRSLRHKYGDLIDVAILTESSPVCGKASTSKVTNESSSSSSKKRARMEIDSDSTATTASEIPASTMNLYSTVWYNLGLIHDKMGSFTDAIRAFNMSLKLRRAMLGRDHPDVACLLYNIGVLQMEQQQLRDATASFREALRIRRVASTGQLNDRHVVKTLQKLSSLHKAKGNISGALEASKEVLQVLEASVDFDSTSRQKHMGMTLRDISELYHSEGDLTEALERARESLKMLRSGRTGSSTEQDDDVVVIDQSCLEQEAAALLLIGSLQHEQCEPSNAQATFGEAARLIRDTLDRHGNSGVINQASIQPLLEVSSMLATSHCAPEA